MTDLEFQAAKIEVAKFCAGRGFQLFMTFLAPDAAEADDWRRMAVAPADNHQEQFYKGKSTVYDAILFPGLGIMDEAESERLAKANPG